MRGCLRNEEEMYRCKEETRKTSEQADGCSEGGHAEGWYDTGGCYMGIVCKEILSYTCLAGMAKS